MINKCITLCLILLLWVSICYADSVVGTYRTVSESEWQIYLTLNNDGSAEIILKNWLPGEFKKRDVKVTKATWKESDGTILLMYEGVVDTFKYTDNYSLEELGLTGGAPGLEQLEPINAKSRIKGHSVWKMPHNFWK